MTNPMIDGVPVRRLPSELLGQSREAAQTIPLTLLRQKPPDVYRLAPEDVLGVWIEGVLGTREQPVPVRYDEQQNVPPSLGYPIPVRDDGTITLPYIKPLKVEGMSLSEVQEAIRKAYVDLPEPILKPGRERIIVTLVRPRTYHVLVVRQDSGGLTIGQTGTIGSTKRGTGSVLELPAYENDVLNALSRTGGLPGLDAVNEVVIQRGYGRVPLFRPDCLPDCTTLTAAGNGETDGADVRLVRIPLRLPPGAEPPFRPDDVILQDGDIVFIEARDTEVYYAGGLLPSGEYPLPRDYDLDVMEAVAQIGGLMLSGGVGFNNLTGQVLGPSAVGFPSPSLLTVLRRTKGGGMVTIRVDLNRAMRDPRERILVQPGDFLFLQETPGEAITRYLAIINDISIIWRAWMRRDSDGTLFINAP